MERRVRGARKCGGRAAGVGARVSSIYARDQIALAVGGAARDAPLVSPLVRVRVDPPPLVGVQLGAVAVDAVAVLREGAEDVGLVRVDDGVRVGFGLELGWS